MHLCLHFACGQSHFNQEPCGFEIETKELCFWTIPIAFENILEGTYLHKHTGFEK